MSSAVQNYGTTTGNGSSNPQRKQSAGGQNAPVSKIEPKGIVQFALRMGPQTPNDTSRMTCSMARLRTDAAHLAPSRPVARLVCARPLQRFKQPRRPDYGPGIRPDIRRSGSVCICYVPAEAEDD